MKQFKVGDFVKSKQVGTHYEFLGTVVQVSMTQNNEIYYLVRDRWAADWPRSFSELEAK